MGIAERATPDTEQMELTAVYKSHILTIGRSRTQQHITQGHIKVALRNGVGNQERWEACSVVSKGETSSGSLGKK